MGALIVARGRFITIEGGEGVGKSLLIQGLASSLRGHSYDIICTREPGGTPAADRIRALFSAPPGDDDLFIETEALLVSAARAQHVRRLIQPNLAQGRWVLCDRFADSTRVYQGILGGIDARQLEAFIEFSTAGLEPELTFLLDCDVSLAQARTTARNAAGTDIAVTRYDEAELSFHVRLREAYLELAQRFRQRFYVIDASLSPAAIAAEAMAVIEDRFFG